VTFNRSLTMMLCCLLPCVLSGQAMALEPVNPPFKAGRFPQEMAERFTVSKEGDALDAIDNISVGEAGIIAGNASGSWRFDGAGWVRTDEKPAAPEAITAPDVEDGLGRVWQGSKSKAVVRNSDGFLWFGVQAGVVFETEDGPVFAEGKDGLPYTSFTCAAAGPGNAVWFGTEKGLVVWRDGQWHYRQGKRWIPDDHVRAIAVDADGGAWVATNGGIGHLYFKSMTLREKADFYEKDMDLFRRTPYGYVSEIAVKEAGNRESEVIQSDSDNDGLWTSMYGAGEAFAYGALKDPVYKERAKKAFEALRFLQKVTQGGSHVPPHGYVARTIRSTSDPDPNIGRVERDRKEAETDALWKVYENRWPRSEDGQWFWKSDTSSDELDGHYFFYPAYYDLCAEDDEEKERVREVVRDLTNHLVDHNFQLIDHDGKPTRWSIYDPENLNHTQAWWNERGLKSLSMLSYLYVAQHITGDERYGREADKLIRDHAYLANAMMAKVQFGPGSGNQSDDEMAVMCYYNLLKYTTRKDLVNQFRYGFYQYYAVEEPERNPFFNFAYAAFGLDANYETIWGTFPIHPRPRWLADSMETLMGFSLDNFDWTLKNSHRLDVVPLTWQASGKDLFIPEPTKRGHLVDGRVLPVENRHFFHWNTDPWQLDDFGHGNALASGTIFLLPYYMGLYHGFIEETE
jgi:hypothetical protein